MYVPECKLISIPILSQFSITAECKAVISTSVVAACLIRSRGSYTHECQIMSCSIIATEWGITVVSSILWNANKVVAGCILQRVS